MKKIYIFCLTVATALFGYNLAAQTSTVAITVPGNHTWTAPCGVTSVTVECWGGGGGGGANGQMNNCGSGGGGGSYAKDGISVTPGATYTLYVGAGGAGTLANTSAQATSGGDTWFGSSTTINAKGGAGGYSAARGGGQGGQASASIGNWIRFSGGNGGNGGTNGGEGGGGGSSAGYNSNGMNGSAQANGGAAVSGGGKGGNGSGTGMDGVNGSFPGGGGGGSSTNSASNGGNGADGQLIITYKLDSAKLTLTSAIGTDSQTVCFNSTIQNIAYQVHLASGATVSGLPPGVRGNFSNNVFTISGAPTPNATLGTYNYTITTTGGCPNDTSITGKIIVNQQQAPNVSVTSSTICQGSNATISASGANTYLWSTGETTGSITKSPSSTTTYTVIGTSDGCPNTTTGSIVVNTLLVASIVGTTTVCHNTIPAPTITFTGSQGTPPYTFTYSINGGPSQTITSMGASNTATMQTFTSTVGVFQYNLLSVQDASCSNSISGYATITVEPIATAGGSTAICQNSSYTLVNGEASAANGSISWTENGAGTITSGQNTLNPTYTAAYGDASLNPIILIMTVTSTNSCYPQTATATYTITVDSLPVATTVGSTTICQNSSYTLVNGEASAANGSISWAHNGNGTLQNSFTLTPTYTSHTGDVGNTVTLTMTVTSTNSCALQAATATATYSIYVGNCTINASILAINESSSGACDGYMEVVTSGDSPSDYLWSDSALVNSAYRYGVCNGVYTVTVTGANGGTTTATAQVGSNSTSNNTTKPLILSVSSTDVSIIDSCNGTATAVIKGGTKPYTMSFANYTGNDSIYTFTNLCAGFYTINASDNAGNSTSFTFVVGSPATTYTNTPIDPIALADTLLSDAVNNCTVDYATISSMQVTGFVFSGNDSVDVTWSITDGSQTTTQVARYSFTANGLYTLVLDMFCTSRASGSAKGIDQLYISRANGITTLQIEDVSIYPNPFADILNITVEEPSTIVISTISGIKVYNGVINAGTNNLALGNLSQGFYFITISNSKGSITQKVVRE